MSHLNGTQTGYGQQSWYDHRNRATPFQWTTLAIVRCNEWRPGVLWSTSRFAGGGMREGFLAVANATDWQDCCVDAGNSSHKRIVGTARDATGAVFPSGATIKAVLTSTDIVQGTCAADSAGYFDCPTREAGAHYVSAYYASVPPKAGHTAKDLIPT